MILLNVFLVGGAIRDKFLKNIISEFDWLVINVNPKLILDYGFKRVGKDFPVFLHPINKEEFAIARKEKKIGKGYYGFKCDFSIYVLLSEDLFRRDLSINSLVLDKFGKLNDFYSGVDDLMEKKIVHISFAFFEDPLRILRVFRFLVKYYNFGFFLSSYISSFIKKILFNGEIFYLGTERILKEFFLSLKYKKCFLFFYFSYKYGILNKLFYDLDKLFILSEFFEFNPYLNFQLQMFNLFDRVYSFSNNLYLKFSLLFYHMTFDILISKNFSKAYCYFRKNFLFISRYAIFFNLSKKHIYFLKVLHKFKFIFNNVVFIKSCDLYAFLLKANSVKDKIRTLNYMIIFDIDKFQHSKIYNFYYKYIFLDLLDFLSDKKTLLNNISYLNYIFYFTDISYSFNKIKKFYKKNFFY
jgi:hypothetical protein